MITAAKWALGILPAGIALGALLGAAVNPEMKDAPAPWWRLTDTDAFTAPAEPALDAWPQDFAAARSYRPDLDYDAEVWALPIPADEAWAGAEEPVAPDSGVAEEAAAKAQAAAGDALAAAAPEREAAPEATPETPAPLPPQLAGLY
jgi:hypothetical protein